MPTQVIQRSNLASNYGGALGTGLGQGLQALVQHKIGQMLQRRQQAQHTTGLQALKGLDGKPMFTPQEAQNLALLDHKTLNEVVKQKMVQQQNMAAATWNPSEESVSPIIEEQQPVSSSEQVAGKQEVLPAEQGISTAIPGKQPLIPQITPVKQPLNIYEKALKSPYITPEQRIKYQEKAQKLAEDRRKEQLVEQRETDKENKSTIKNTSEEFKNAYASDRRLTRMKELVGKGDLSRPRWHSFLKTLSNGIFGFGIDLHSLETADSQEFNKLSNEFIKEAKEMFGARITDADLSIFLKMIPTLSMSGEGKARVINNMQLYNEGNRIKYNTMNQIMKENNGKSPRNLDLLIEERSAPALDELAKRFKEGIPQKGVSKKPADGFFPSNIKGPGELVTEALYMYFGQG